MEKYTGEQNSFKNITITGGFWKKKQDLFRGVTMEAVYDRFEETGRFEALKFNWKEGMPNRPHIFWESDVTKWIEGAAYFLQKRRDPLLEEKIDELVGWMERAQEENGYLNAYFTVVEPEARFTRRTDHELYSAGHLIEGAIAYAQATGKNALLRVAVTYADLIDRVFRIEHSAGFDTPGHEEIELALMKLFRYTGEERYKALAEYFINTRGTSERDETYSFTDQEHMQSHLPVRKQLTAEGHSVRALYLYSGMADLAKENKEEELAGVCEALFDNIVNQRMYITGGVGSTHRGESFSFDYDLPEYTAYNETCASIALALFARRMWLIEADGKYADAAEQAIYNTVLGGISISGDSFFYENPMSVDPRRNAFNDSRPEGLKEHLPILERAKVFGCSCCPPNLLRFVGSIADFMYATSGSTVFTHCYMNGTGTVSIGGREILLEQKTEYPYEGDVQILVKTAGAFTIALRIPGWASAEKAELTVNGEKIVCAPVKGYVYVDRSFAQGDCIHVKLPLETRIVEANPRVSDLCGRAAVVRGPIVFCAEGIDNAYLLRDVRIQRESAVNLERETIGGLEIPVLTMKAWKRKESAVLYSDKPYGEEETQLKLIPYFAWANRGVSEMTTWFLQKDGTGC